MKIIFFGTPYYVLPICEALRKEFNRGREKQFFAVVTQPPKESGRDKKVTRSEVDHWAFKHKLEIYFDLDNLPEADLGICASYGQIIPEKILQKFKYGILNIHPSLLPKYRGASPVQGAIANGEETTGVTIFKMDSQMDHGPIVSSFKEKIKSDDTAQSLRDRLFERSAQFLIDLIPNYLNGKVKPKDQNHDEATFTKIISKQDGYIQPQILEAAISNSQFSISKIKIDFIKDCELEANSQTVDNLIRAMNPWPGVWTHVNLEKRANRSSDSRLSGWERSEPSRKARSHSDEHKRLKILKSHLDNEKLILDKVQLEGKNPVSWEQFKQGYPDYSF